MEFEWDPDKNRENFRKHQVSFSRAAKIFQGDVLTWEDIKADYGEHRMIAIGRAERRLLRVVYTERGNRIRLISARRASRNDRQKYHDTFLR